MRAGAATVYVPVDLCHANKGRLQIFPNGVVRVSAEIKFSDAACFTSLDGVMFATSAAKFSRPSLQNNWRAYGLGTYKPAAQVSSGIVRFEGAIATSSSVTNLILFTLPKNMRPAYLVHVEVDLCGANNGRLDIPPNGQAFVYAEGGTVQNAKCFTSLDGAWFAR